MRRESQGNVKLILLHSAVSIFFHNWVEWMSNIMYPSTQGNGKSYSNYLTHNEPLIICGDFLLLFLPILFQPAGPGRWWWWCESEEMRGKEIILSPPLRQYEINSQFIANHQGTTINLSSKPGRYGGRKKSKLEWGKLLFILRIWFNWKNFLFLLLWGRPATMNEYFFAGISNYVVAISENRLHVLAIWWQQNEEDGWSKASWRLRAIPPLILLRNYSSIHIKF